MSTLAEAYERCEQITRTEAKNFSYGIRLLPDRKRQAMSALYAFARRVDDIGDGDQGTAEKLTDLARVRDQLSELKAGIVPEDDPVLVALYDAHRRFEVPIEALVEIVAGCEMDCRQHRYETFADLVTYCRYVAGSVGRLSLSIFGTDAMQEASELADTLGIALQVTNILRDIVEDRTVMGRVYLPIEDLEKFGCAKDATGPQEAMAELIRFEAGRARENYAVGLLLLDYLDYRSRACVSAMAGIYRRLLVRIDRDPLAVLERRVSLPGWEKAWVAARSLGGFKP